MFKEKLIIALFSTITFSLILALMEFTPVSERLPDTSYGTLFSPMPFLILLTGVPYFLGGIPVSMLIDKYVNKTIIKLPLYLIVGYIVAIIYLVLNFGVFASEFFWFGLYGVAGSLIFFTIMSLKGRLNSIKQKV